ncbi:hypothetical protein [Rhodoferax sp. WC2427]|uniref:hypothetical protein n=1 Tax=Rhodoferax sp. WC2427 TaxID=3234144 RepID=UPI0034652AD9
MPVPVIAAAAAILAPIVAAIVVANQTDVGRHIIDRVVESYGKDVEKWALQKAFETMGLALDPENGFNKEAITAAINAGPLANTGVQLTDIFNRDAVKKDLHKVALLTAVQKTGLDIKTLDVDGMKQALRDYVSARVIEQVGEGGGDLIDGALPLVKMVQKIREANKKAAESGAPVPPGYQPGRDKPYIWTKKAISNRERQARYRASHKRVWELK